SSKHLLSTQEISILVRTIGAHAERQTETSFTAAIMERPLFFCSSMRIHAMKWLAHSPSEPAVQGGHGSLILASGLGCQFTWRIPARKPITDSGNCLPRGPEARCRATNAPRPTSVPRDPEADQGAAQVGA